MTLDNKISLLFAKLNDHFRAYQEIMSNTTYLNVLNKENKKYIWILKSIDYLKSVCFLGSQSKMKTMAVYQKNQKAHL